MGKEARLKKANKPTVVCPLHLGVYTCPRCEKCFKCEHTQTGELPEKYWVCGDNTKIWAWPGEFKEVI